MGICCTVNKVEKQEDKRYTIEKNNVIDIQE